jgi:hypothetical protein
MGRKGTHVGFGLESQGKEPLRKPRHMWVDNNKLDLGGRRWGGMDWIGLAQDRDKSDLL